MTIWMLYVWVRYVRVYVRMLPVHVFQMQKSRVRVGAPMPRVLTKPTQQQGTYG